MSDPFETIAKLKARYPDDIEQIEADQARVSALLKSQEYYLLPQTQELVALCRSHIAAAQKRLATERTLTPEERDALWHIIDAREWFLSMVVKDYDEELDQITRDLAAELSE
jgi:hypothetical protein